MVTVNGTSSAIRDPRPAISVGGKDRPALAHHVQHELDQLNTALGFLHPLHEREDLGKITHEGRYRVWKEIWMLNYLGRAARYE